MYRCFILEGDSRRIRLSSSSTWPQNL